MNRRDILYVTHNGITDHIGQSQIAPYCMALAERGHGIHIVSAEKPGRDDLTAKYRKLFDDRGIGWSTVTYHNRPQVIAQLWDIVQMRLLADRTSNDAGNATHGSGRSYERAHRDLIPHPESGLSKKSQI